MFTKEERSTFPYWFAHWCAFQMTALNLRCWKFHHLFHDMEKPWMRLFLPYKKVQEFHRHHNKHHIEYYLDHGVANWLDLVIDWECSRFTKTACPRNCREECISYLSVHEKELTQQQISDIYNNIMDICDKIGI